MTMYAYHADLRCQYPLPVYISARGELFIYEACTPCSATASWLPGGCIKPLSGVDGIGDVYRPADQTKDPVAFEALEDAVLTALRKGRVLPPGRYKLTCVKRRDRKQPRLLPD